jgi:hypothetical protein
VVQLRALVAEAEQALIFRVLLLVALSTRDLSLACSSVIACSLQLKLAPVLQSAQFTAAKNLVRSRTALVYSTVLSAAQ